MDPHPIIYFKEVNTIKKLLVILIDKLQEKIIKGKKKKNKLEGYKHEYMTKNKNKKQILRKINKTVGRKILTNKGWN